MHLSRFHVLLSGFGAAAGSKNSDSGIYNRALNEHRRERRARGGYCVNLLVGNTHIQNSRKSGALQYRTPVLNILSKAWVDFNVGVVGLKCSRRRSKGAESLK